MSEQMLLGGRYRVEQELGRGGMAKVFKGTDEVLGRPVAIKVLAPQLADDQSYVARFRREAQAAARLNHPNLVAVYDTGEDDGVKYIVMEYVEGKTLAEYLADGGRIMPDRAMEIAEDVCNALSVAHAAGIVHRDIKPGNIMLTPRGEVKVSDFGIARVPTTGDTVAQTVAVLGTASYLSPEQAQGQTVDRRSDVYSLGCVLYEMLTGQAPFVGDSPVTVASKHVLDTPLPPSKLNPDVSRELDAVVLKALAKNPANRYQTAEELRADLERARRNEPVIATPLLAEPPGPQAAQVPTAQTTALLPPTRSSGGGGKRWPGLLVALLILAVLGAGGYFVATALLSEQPKQVKVPRVLGLTLEAATSELVNAGFKVAPPVMRVTDDPTKVGIVLAQDPLPGQLADEGSTVTITVGKAPKQVLVPNVVDMDEADARAEIEAARLTVGTVTPQASTTVPVGRVISQDPLPDTPVSPGTPVDLVVSSGPTMLTVPDVTCLSYGAAKALLDKYGFGIELAGEMPAIPLCPNGSKVVRQDPVANSQAEQGTVVRVWVGTQASPSPTPTP